MFKKLYKEILIKDNKIRITFNKKEFILIKSRRVKILITIYIIYRKYGYNSTYIIKKYNAIGNRNLNYYRTNLNTRREFSENLNIVKKIFNISYFTTFPDEGDII